MNKHTITLGRFSASVAHRVKNPLSSIKAITQSMAEDLPRGDSRRSDLEIVIGEVGWPSAGRMRRGALPSPANQARVMADVLERGRREHFRVNVEQTLVPMLHDATLALQAARDIYTRRGEGLSIWVVPSSAITASDPAEKGMMFEPAESKIYRHPTFYDVPEEVGHM